MVILDPATASMFKATLREFGQDVHRELHTDHYTLWKRDRPLTTWDTGDASEGWELLGSGTGKLSPHGAGGPQMGEGIVYPESPFKFRTLATAFDAVPTKVDPSVPQGFSKPDVSVCVLVVNGERMFRVDAFKRGAERRVNATAYLRELLNVPLPTEVTP